MYFKRLEIFGFKSFPDKVKIIFEPGITAVVGPNGSGKTNIADAIRWILGEQSPRMLRGGCMEDVIFAGTESRKPLGFAEAFVTLDNSREIFPVEFSELNVGRRLYRSGESEYYINKNPCRLKDIEELFMDTGLGKKAYSLIDQEKMQLILNSSPEERRTLFEEAAGIMKYKVRKEESLRKLEKTEENLRRLGDVIGEVERQLNSISRHFQKARRYKKYKDELDGLEIKLGKSQWGAMQSALKLKNEESLQAKAAKEELSKRISQEEGKIESLRRALTDIDMRLSKEQTQDIVKKKEIESADEKIKLSEDYLNELEEEEKTRAIQLEFLTEKKKEREKEKIDVHKKIEDLNNKEEEVEKRVAVFQKKASLASNEVEFLREALGKIKLEIFELVRTASQIKNKLGMLSGTHIERNKRAEDYFHNVQGKIKQLFKVDSRYAAAIEASLGGDASALLVEDFFSVKECLSLIKKKKSGRRKFIALDDIPKRITSKMPDWVLKDKDVIGEASDLIECEARHKVLFDYLLREVLVVKDFDTAERILNRLTSPGRIVTLDGEYIEIPRIVSGGNLEERGEFLKDLEEKEKSIKDLEDELKNEESKFEEKNKELDALREIIVNSKIELKTIKEKRVSFTSMVKYLKGTSEENNSSLASWNEVLEKRQERKKTLKENIENMKKKIDLFILEGTGLNKEILNLQGEKEELTRKLTVTESSYREMKKKEELFQEAVHNLDVEMVTLEAESNNLAGRLEETHGFSLSPEEPWEPMDKADGVKERIKFLKERLRSMGAVDMVAIDEHKELEERAHFLKTQSEDLKKSRESLLKMIQEINQTTRVLFMETFSQIQKHFFEIFRSLFGGGNAKLILQNSEDVLNSGIEIVVSPPGKKLQNINLLSGGEKTLTAITLLFALFKVKPSPFCVLDEIDAALDESNVHRFTALLRNFSDKSQFIVITHNKETIAGSDIIYGVTMEEPGVSKIVSVKLGEKKPEPTSLTEETVSAIETQHFTINEKCKINN